MKIKVAGMMVWIFVLAIMLAGCGGKTETAKTEKANTETAAKTDETDAKEKEALEAGIEAYIYGYPLVTMEMTRRVMTNVAKPEATRAPMGQYVRMRT